MVRLNASNPLAHARALIADLALRETCCAGHGERVVVIAERIARRMGLSEHDIEAVRLAAELHDLGKCEIPDAVLTSPASLDREAWDMISAHPTIGARMLAESGDPALTEIAPYVRSHHEYMCGKGYPDGLVGERIPLISRIIALADAYDAMSAPRPYRFASSHPRIMDVLSGEVGIRWDPQVFLAFQAVMQADPALAVKSPPPAIAAWGLSPAGDPAQPS
ncbi:HD-GYP domain-containing protein [Niveibacterium microcysteis]|uniref:HD domain-containing protein n=1 Tax=Niveibacterium microcysteis TaxID=2811415 RepID=A0ABX7M3S0_9RHOO|nr:HD domain-containing phosphohydrolase [Niveibacterium microcysteis]QSI76407.1 HD domain-containing protein [Niveibacterium microcysteis]